MKQKNKKRGANHINWLEMKRQAFHIFLGPVLIFLLEKNILDEFRLLLLILLGVILSFVSLHAEIPVISWFLYHFERADDLKWFPGKGKIFYFLGVLLCLLLFDKDIAYASIIILAFGDSFSHLVGRHYGKIRHPLNQLRIFEGWAAGVLLGCLGAAFFVPLWYAFFGSLIAMSVEVLEIEAMHKTADDNLFVPLVAGAVMHGLRYFV